MSFSDKIVDPVGERSSDLDEQDVIQKKFKCRQTSLEHSPHSDPVAMTTVEKIRACGVNLWLRHGNEYLLSFEFANEEQGIIPVQKTTKSGSTVMVKYNGMTNEIVFEDDTQLLLKWSDKRQTLSSWYKSEKRWFDLLPIRALYQNCPLKWYPVFQTDKWLSYEFPSGKLGQVHTCRLYCDEVNLTAQGVPICGDGLDETGPYSLKGFFDFNQHKIIIQKSCTGSGKTANLKYNPLHVNTLTNGFMGSVKPQNVKYFIRPIIQDKRTGDGLDLAIDTALAMNQIFEDEKELTSIQPSHDSAALYHLLNFNIWNLKFHRSSRFHLYTYGTIKTNCIGVAGYSEFLGGNFPIQGQFDLATEKMILHCDWARFEVTWIASEEKFQGQHEEGYECVIEPVTNKYDNSTLYDILVNSEFVIRKPNMMIIKALFEGKIKAAKVYPVADREQGLSILKTEAYFQRLCQSVEAVKIHEALFVQSPTGPCVVLIMDWYKNGSMSLQIKLRAHLTMKFTEGEILTILVRLLIILDMSSDANLWHRDIKPDNILANDDGLPYLMDFGEAIQQPRRQPSKLAGTPKYMSYKMKTAFKAWNRRSPFPTVDHDSQASDVMSIAQTVIAMCRLSEDSILNDLDTCDEAQRIVWEELRQYYSEGLVVLLQSMMKQDETERAGFYRAFMQVCDLLEKLNLPRYTGLDQISIAPEVDQTSVQEEED